MDKLPDYLTRTLDWPIFFLTFISRMLWMVTGLFVAPFLCGIPAYLIATKKYNFTTRNFLAYLAVSYLRIILDVIIPCLFFAVLNYAFSMDKITAYFYSYVVFALLQARGCAIAFKDNDGYYISEYKY